MFFIPFPPFPAVVSRLSEKFEEDVMAHLGEHGQRGVTDANNSYVYVLRTVQAGS